jgi:hypothetical protein
VNIKHGLSLISFGVNNLHTQHFSSSLIRFSSSESDSEVLLVFVSGLTDGQSCQAIDSFCNHTFLQPHKGGRITLRHIVIDLMKFLVPFDVLRRKGM